MFVHKMPAEQGACNNWIRQKLGHFCSATRQEYKYGDLNRRIKQELGNISTKISTEPGDLNSRIRQEPGNISAKISIEPGDLNSRLRQEPGNISTRFE